MQLISEETNTTCLFFHLDEGESRESMHAKFVELKENGIECFIGCPSSGEYMGWAFWTDMDIMIDELQKLGMRFFIQDEQTFPSGEANGWIRRRRPDLAKRFVDFREIDAVGPLRGASFNIGSWLNPKNMQDILRVALNSPLDGGANVVQEMVDKAMGARIPMNEQIAVVAMRKDTQSNSLYGECIDLTGRVVDGWLYWDVPEGLWHILVIFKTYKSTGRDGYINMIDRESVRVLIDALYEPMYDRYKEHFGKTFRGFFTDEPEFGNVAGYGAGYKDNTGIGKDRVPLPWCDELEQLLIDTYGPAYYLRLPALWYDCGKETNAAVRYTYMDLVTKLYEKNFVGQIGQWCTDHGCLYTGHLVEDAGNHARLGAGAGHYFRAMHGQTLGGIDVVENQLLPGFDHKMYRWTLGTNNGEEFVYMLAKLGSSAAHIDPKKKGKVLCETFAAYEKVHGIKHLKWVCDNLVSRGINQMMLNFSKASAAGGGWNTPRTIPNLGYRGFSTLTAYLTRICDLINDGRHIAPVAVLYHAEAEWAGQYMSSARPIHELAMAQIDCDILPIDVYTKAEEYAAAVTDGALCVNEERYRALVIPYCEFICPEALDFVRALNIPVLFIDALPSGVVGGDNARLAELKKCVVVKLGEVANWLTAQGIRDIHTSSSVPGLRYYRYAHEDLELYLLFNEYPYAEVDTDLTFPSVGKCAQYDALSNRFFAANEAVKGANTTMHIHLAPGETVLVLFGDLGDVVIEQRPVTTTAAELGSWQFSSAEALAYPNFTVPQPIEKLENLGAPGKFQVSNHTFRYETTVDLAALGDHMILDLGEVYDMAELSINGKPAGIRICAPYTFEVENYFHPGQNTITIDVTGTNRSADSQCSMFESLGLLGPVMLRNS